MIVNVPLFPVIQEKESDNFTNLVTTNMPQIRSNWGDIVEAASNAYGVDPNIMLGFIAIESPDLKDDAVSSAGAIGVMQMQVATAFDYVCKQAPKISPAYAAIVQKYMPGFLKPGGFTGFYSTWKAKVEDALYQADFNIWTGITGLSQMIWADLQSNNGNLRLDHVVIKYNAGGDNFSGNYHKYVVAAGLKDADPATLLASFPLVETKAYLIKLLGIDGSVVIACRTSSG